MADEVSTVQSNGASEIQSQAQPSTEQGQSQETANAGEDLEGFFSKLKSPESIGLESEEKTVEQPLEDADAMELLRSTARVDLNTTIAVPTGVASPGFNQNPGIINTLGRHRPRTNLRSLLVRRH